MINHHTKSQHLVNHTSYHLPLQESSWQHRHMCQSPSALQSQWSAPRNFFFEQNSSNCVSFRLLTFQYNVEKLLYCIVFFPETFTMRCVYAFSLMSTLRTLPPGFTGRSSPENFTFWVLSTKVTTWVCYLTLSTSDG